MPFDGIRDFLSYLDAENELARVTKEIDTSSYEVSVILERLQRLRGKAVSFENLKNYNGIPMCANILGTFRRISMALETTEESLAREWSRRRLSNHLVPRHVSDGPCKESVIREECINLFSYPILKWNPLDVGRYITLGVLVTNDPETGERNAGIYRLMLQGKRQLGINMLEMKHATFHYKKAEAKGDPLEAAVVIGVDPAIVLAAATNLKLGEDEIAFAGALRNEPVKVTSCQTVDIDVPAYSEIVIEGIIPPKIRAVEGPFGESTGNYGAAHYSPIMQIKTITQREKPIFQATYTGKPPKEEHFIAQTTTNSCYKSIDGISQPSISISQNLWNVYCKLTRRSTVTPIQLPQKTIDKVKRNWRHYGLD